MSLKGSEQTILPVKVMVDHIVIGAPDLLMGMDYVFQRTKLRPVMGGRHPQWNTQNALLSLGAETYLEVIAPQTGLKPGKPFEILSELDRPEIITWAARTTDINALGNQLKRLHLAHSGVLPGTRLKEDGTRLNWNILFPENNFDGVFPFFIQWDPESIHPAHALKSSLVLNKLLLYHEKAGFINECFKEMQMDLPCHDADAPAIKIELDGPSGKIVF